MHSSTHPWRSTARGVQTIDPIVTSRTSQFAAYLETLQPAERRQIETAERTYVTRANVFTSPHQAAARDFAEGMLGNLEDMKRTE